MGIPMVGRSRPRPHRVDNSTPPPPRTNPVDQMTEIPGCAHSQRSALGASPVDRQLASSGRRQYTVKQMNQSHFDVAADRPRDVLPSKPVSLTSRQVLAVATILLALPMTRATAAPTATLLIAPHISGEAFCDSAVNDARIVTEDDAAAACAKHDENAADRITTLLDSVGPPLSPSRHFALGYTLDLPLMRFFSRTLSGWTLDPRAIEASVCVIHDVKRPVVVYLSANHFTDGGLALSEELAHDPQNLMWTKDGPLKANTYFAVALHAWTLTKQDAPINVLRRRAFAAVLDAICRLDPISRARITGVSLLGEVHQLYGNYQAGQGYAASYDVTDYAPQAVAGFRQFLARRFGHIAALNAMAGSSFHAFLKSCRRRRTSGMMYCKAFLSTSILSQQASCRSRAGRSIRPASRFTWPSIWTGSRGPT